MKGCAVVLAAGLGTRMKSSVPKVLHKLLGKTIIEHVVGALSGLEGLENISVVVSNHCEGVREVLAGFKGVQFAVQVNQLGTADAFKVGLTALGDYGYVLVTAGDTPLIKRKTLDDIIQRHISQGSDLTVVSFRAEKPSAYGRIVRDSAGCPLKILEAKDASDEQLKIDEVNSGIYVFSKRALPLVYNIKKNEKKGEYYLTDIVELCNAEGFKTDVFCTATEAEFIGINTRYELMNARGHMQREVIRRWLEEGVGFMDENSVVVDVDVEIGQDSVIYPNVVLEGKTHIGKGCTIRSNVSIRSCIIEDNVTIKENTVMDGSAVLSGASVGPFAHIRPNSLVGTAAKIGNFVELKNAQIGYNTKASHLSYIGDAILGDNINIGAGTITCNYDGKHKHKTVIKDGVFIGSDSQLIAPVTVEEGAFVAAGSTITEDVPKGALAVARTKQRNISGGALRIHAKGGK
ncbi:MAG: bifunctional UDP-N-acetylglucosamine diphosphorylase/glucosamine-1-phosphate N-acetyltransferase GlmU [Candidatus Magnetoovum sp. WYHC-5]|nr:bifunctional UDP-N-acetylglucosamine diphosphorylase/glucosamine-1-phosphate N-acetyltransferase GlmU [Candidatus Magnetoovum sp. WYHC-5]